MLIQGGKFFTKYSDLINHLYQNEIEGQEICSSKKWFWKSKSDAIENIRICFSKKLDIKDEDRLKYSKERYVTRTKLLAITANDIIDLGLGA